MRKSQVTRQGLPLLTALVSTLLGCAFSATLAPPAALAGDVYKCVGADGKVAYKDTPCATDAKQKVMSVGSSHHDVETYWCNDGVAPSELVSECLESWRPVLRDPRGAYAEGGMLVHDKAAGTKMVFVDGYAKNGFGGINSFPMKCGIDGEHIDSKNTTFWQDNARIVEPSKMPPPRIEQCPSE